MKLIINTFKEDLENKIDVISLKREISNMDDLENPNNVKVICDNDSNAIYFSRKALPYNRSKSNLKHYKHIGVYAFRKKALFSFSKLKKSVLEKAEMIEAIRFIENGIKIKILEVFNEYISIDTIEDLKRVKKILND